MALPMLIPTWVWVVAALMLGLMSAGSIGVMARRRTLFGAAKAIF